MVFTIVVVSYIAACLVVARDCAAPDDDFYFASGHRLLSRPDLKTFASELVALVSSTSSSIAAARVAQNRHLAFHIDILDLEVAASAAVPCVGGFPPPVRTTLALDIKIISALVALIAIRKMKITISEC